MRTTVPARCEVEQVEKQKMNSRYGSVLKNKAKAHMTGHLKNISQFTNPREVSLERVIMSNYDQFGKQIKFKTYAKIDPVQQVFVQHQKNSKSDT